MVPDKIWGLQLWGTGDFPGVHSSPATLGHLRQAGGAAPSDQRSHAAFRLQPCVPRKSAGRHGSRRQSPLTSGTTGPSGDADISQGGQMTLYIFNNSPESPSSNSEPTPSHGPWDLVSPERPRKALDFAERIKRKARACLKPSRTEGFCPHVHAHTQPLFLTPYSPLPPRSPWRPPCPRGVPLHPTPCPRMEAVPSGGQARTAILVHVALWLPTDPSVLIKPSPK